MKNSKNKEVDFSKNKWDYVQTLGMWLDGVVRSKSRSEVFSILELDKKLKDPKQWLGASIFIYDCLLSLLETEETDLKSYLCIPLLRSAKATNIEDITYSYIQEEISMEEAPMIYLSPDGNSCQCVFIEKLSKELQKRVYFEEVKDSVVEHVRCIFVFSF